MAEIQPLREKLGKGILPSPPSDPSLYFARHQGDRLGAQGMALLGLGGFCLAWFISHHFGLHEAKWLISLFLGMTALPMIWVSICLIRTHSRASSGLDGEKRPIAWSRCSIKWLGLAMTTAGVGVFYWLIPEYHGKSYQSIWFPLASLAAILIIGAFPYIVWVDRRMAHPLDGYWGAGLFVLGRWRGMDWKCLQCHALNWTIKGFFLPFMLSGMVSHLDLLEKYGMRFDDFEYLYQTGFNLLLSIDITFGAVGYLLTLRILDAQIKSPQPTCLGWVSAIMCYAPFSAFVWTKILPYKANTNWQEWLAPHPLLFVSWGFIILLLEIVYVWSTCSFGCRFSNLTNRGIIVDGPYRYVKHPAYLAKNMAWWLISVPFVAHATNFEAIRACLLLLITNGIYFVRALTEERHLREDEAYIAYSQWIKSYGLFANLRQTMKCAAWGIRQQQ